MVRKVLWFITLVYCLRILCNLFRTVYFCVDTFILPYSCQFHGLFSWLVLFAVVALSVYLFHGHIGATCDLYIASSSSITTTLSSSLSCRCVLLRKLRDPAFCGGGPISTFPFLFPFPSRHLSITHHSLLFSLSFVTLFPPDSCRNVSPLVLQKTD